MEISSNRLEYAGYNKLGMLNEAELERETRQLRDNVDLVCP